MGIRVPPPPPYLGSIPGHPDLTEQVEDVCLRDLMRKRADDFHDNVHGAEERARSLLYFHPDREDILIRTLREQEGIIKDREWDRYYEERKTYLASAFFASLLLLGVAVAAGLWYWHLVTVATVAALAWLKDASKRVFAY